MSNNNLLPYIFLEMTFCKFLILLPKIIDIVEKKNLKSSMNTFKNGQQGNNDVSVHYYRTKYKL